MSSTVCVLSGVAVLAVLVGHAANGRGSRRDWGGRSWSRCWASRRDWRRRDRSKHADVMGSAVCVLSGVAVLTVLVGHASECWWSRAGWRRADGRSRDADSVLANGGIVISSLAIGIGAAAEQNGRGRLWRGSNADVALTSVSGSAVCTVGIGLTADDEVGAVIDWNSRGQSSECYDGKRCDC